MSKRPAGSSLPPSLRAAPWSRLALRLAPLLVASRGGVVAGEGDVGPETGDADHAGGDVDVPPDVHDVPSDEGTIGDADVPVEDVADVPPECTRVEDCDDGEPCNGVDDCVEGACVDGTPPPDGSGCSTAGVEVGICRSGLCAPASCGDGAVASGEECDDGNLINGDGCETSCQLSCHEDSECIDGQDCTEDLCSEVALGRRCFNSERGDGELCEDADPCTVAEQCSDGLCLGDPRFCDDTDSCTVDSCDPEGPAIDPCVHRRMPDWFRDRDGDRYGGLGEQECSETAPGDEWVSSGGDCCDVNVDVHPSQPAFFVEPYVCSGTGSFLFDYDCNGSGPPP